MAPSLRELSWPISREAMTEGAARPLSTQKDARLLPPPQCEHWGTSLREGGKCSQQILGSCAPVSFCKIRFPPKSVRMTSLPGQSALT